MALPTIEASNEQTRPVKPANQRWLLLPAWTSVLLLLAAGVLHASDEDRRREAAEQFRENLAFHVGTLAYVYGYPIVDLGTRMHNETHRVDPNQETVVAVNRLTYRRTLVTPDTQGNRRAPNTDTLYFGGWLDLSAGPVVIHAPDTSDRYYTMAVTNFYSEVEHLGRRTTGTQERYFVLTKSDWEGELSSDLHRVTVETDNVWILGRLLVEGPDDLPAALALLDGFWAAPLRSAGPIERPSDLPIPAGERVDPLGSLDFFTELNAFLRRNPARPSEAALLAQFDAVGIGPAGEFVPSRLDPATRRGLTRAIASGRALIDGASSMAFKSLNGWTILGDAGRYGHDYLLRAQVARGGYANLPEESVYPGRTTDDRGRPLTGERCYRIHFPPGALPPVDGFWSISVYDARTRLLVANPIDRYSIGDRSAALSPAKDGSVTLRLQAEAPRDGTDNWLPTPEGPFMAVMRLYEPRPSVLDGAYRLPPIESVGDRDHSLDRPSSSSDRCR